MVGFKIKLFATLVACVVGNKRLQKISAHFPILSSFYSIDMKYQHILESNKILLEFASLIL